MKSWDIWIIPRDFRDKISTEDRLEIANRLEGYSHGITEGSVSFTDSDTVRFVSGGENPKKIKCNFCTRTIHKEEWLKELKLDYSEPFGHAMEKRNFGCCDEKSRLDGLLYINKCGFAKSTINFKVFSHFKMDWLRNYPYLTHVSSA